MSDWVSTLDKNTGRTYYYNKQTKETSWNKPEGLDEPGPESVRENWLATVDKASGKSYYFNRVTKVTTWNKPACFGASEDAPVAQTTSGESSTEDLGDPKDWREVEDKATGKVYYYHIHTKKTSWVKPAGFDAAHNNSSKAPTIGRSFPGLPEENSQKIATLRNRLVDGDSDDEDDDVGRAHKLLDDDQDAADAGRFRFAKHRKGWVNRTFRSGHIMDEKEILTYKKSMIKKALLKQNREFDAEAMQSFKNIMSFMGDRKSHKSDVGHAHKLIANGLAAPESLKDEMFLQVCKQVSEHPDESHALKGWHLMRMLLGAFPPSKSMFEFLHQFLERAADAGESDDVMRQARICVDRLVKIDRMGPRSEPPAHDEIQADIQGQLLPLKIYTLDSSMRTIDADPFVTVSEARRDIAQKLNLSFSLPFSLFEYVKGGEERILDEDSRILDVYARWERLAREQKLSGDEPFRFVFKAELVLKTSNKNLIEDENAVNLMYIQAVHDLIVERYPFEEKDCPSLAALQLQASFGDYDPSLHTQSWVLDKLGEIIPPSLYQRKKAKRSKLKAAELSQKILTKYTKLVGVRAPDAKISYLDYAQDWPLYGAWFITVEQKQFKDYPPYLKCAITCDAILLVHPETMDVLDSYGYHEIVTWGYSDEKFILVVGNLVQQSKMFFKTNRGKFMNKLVHDYVKTKVPQ